VTSFSICTAYAAGTNVQYGGVLYQALSAISASRDCPPTAPNNPSNDNWWSDIGTCAPGTAATPTPAPTSGGAGSTTGSLNYHLLLGAGSTGADSMTLDGGNYNDLIMSNIIAGVMLGRLIDEGYPAIQYNKDYVYGSIMGQLLQENLATQEYVSSSDLIDPATNQQVVMGVGQGGPYQINMYVQDMVSATTTPQGHALVNYILIQKNIGFTIASSPAQASLSTPPSFNNKYYGPMLTAFFHYNDMQACSVIGKGTGYVPPWQPQYDQALANFVNLPGSFLDIVFNVAYNQGYYGGLLSQYSTLGATATAATVTTVDSYTSVQGSSYGNYPYQVRDYADQMYDKPIPFGSLTNLVTPTNHIAFDMTLLESVFSHVFQTLSYSDGTKPAQFFTPTQGQAAFTAALASKGIAGTATLDLSTATDRAKIFGLLEAAIANIEAGSGMKFNASTLSQL
jgi:hypothetical protein